jgi:hypothetical protein
MAMGRKFPVSPNVSPSGISGTAGWLPMNVWAYRNAKPRSSDLLDLEAFAIIQDKSNSAPLRGPVTLVTFVIGEPH